jgi:predicted nucleic acid-binding Zn ribbon protein
MLKCEGRWAAKIEELLTPHTVDEEKPEPRILTEDEGGCAYCGAELPPSFQARRFCKDGCKVMAAKRRAMGKPEARGMGLEVTTKCAGCAADFTYLRVGKPRLTCSERCQRVVSNRKRQARRLLQSPTT